MPPVEEPRIPWLGSTWECPPGWGPREEDGVVACDPWPEGRLDCEGTSAHFPGEPGCRSIASGETEWPRDLPATDVIFIRPGAVGGDGTRERPFGSFNEVPAGAVVFGTTFALAPGIYEGPLFVGADGISIRGTSADTTVVHDPTPHPGRPLDATETAVGAFGTELSFSDLTISGDRLGFTLAGGDARLERVLIREVRVGVLATGGTGRALTVTDAIFDGVAHAAAADGNSIDIRRAVVRRGAGFAVTATGEGAMAHLEDFAVIGLNAAPGADAFAFQAEQGGRIELARAAVQDVDTAALAQQGDIVLDDLYVTGWRLPAIAADTGGRVIARRVVARRGADALHAQLGGSVEAEDVIHVQLGSAEDGPARPFVVLDDGTISARRTLAVVGFCGSVQNGTVEIEDFVCRGGAGVSAYSGTGTLRRLRLSDVMIRGVCASFGAELDLEDVHVDGVGPREGSDPEETAGLCAWAGGRLNVQRATLERVAGSALMAIDGVVTATDVHVSETLAVVPGILTAAVRSRPLGRVELRSALIERTTTTFGAWASGGALVMEDVVLRDLGGDSGNGIGVAIENADLDIEARLARVRIERARDLGVLLAGGRPAIEDLVIEDVIPRPSDETLGYGMELRSSLDGAMVVTASHVSITGVHGAGVLAVHPGVEASFFDLRIEAVEALACAADAGCGPTSGVGVSAQDGALVSMWTFVVRDVAGTGLQAVDATVNARNGLIVGATACSEGATETDVTHASCGEPSASEWRPTPRP